MLLLHVRVPRERKEMFESDDWIFEDTFDDICKKASRSSPLRRNEEESSATKRRKIDSCQFGPSQVEDTFGFQLDAEVNTPVNDNSSASSRSDKSNASRGNVLLKFFQDNAASSQITASAREPSKAPSSPPEAKSIASHRKESKRKNAKSTSKAELKDQEVKLVRMFPGPAGLVPDTKSDSIPAASYLSSAIELENKSTKRLETTLSKAQDEKNLFDEKAWRLLLDDLPSDFFQEYGISAMKGRANAGHCDGMRVRLVAGMIEYIDHSHDDPLIVLKDSTGSVEGTVHRDIALSYPGVLEPNVVVLLRDVGLLKTVAYVVTNKYHVLISRANLLAVYSDKGRIVSTSHVKDILSGISSNDVNKDHCTPALERCTAGDLQRMNEDCDDAVLRTISSTSKSSNDAKLESSRKYIGQVVGRNSGSCKIVTKSTCEYQPMNMDDLDMNDFFVDCEFTSSAEQKRVDLSSKVVPRIGKVERCELQAQRTNYLEDTSKKSMIHLERRKKNETQSVSQTLEERVTEVAITDAHSHRSYQNRLSSGDDRKHETQRDSNSTLTKAAASPTMKHNSNAEITRNLSSYFADDNKYDSDDEFLSQLDIDNISSSVAEKR